MSGLSPTSAVSAAPRLVYDVSSLVQGVDRRPSGIERVMLEVAWSLASSPRGDVRFAVFDADADAFLELGRDEVVDLCLHIRGLDRPEPGSQTRVRNGATAARAWVIALREGVRGVRLAGKELRELIRKSRRRPAACFSHRWDETTTYCLIDSAFSGIDYDSFADLRRRRGFRSVLMVHDLIPEIAPQFAPWRSTDRTLRTLACADVVSTLR